VREAALDAMRVEDAVNVLNLVMWCGLAAVVGKNLGVRARSRFSRDTQLTDRTRHGML
jgi:hypothetical protein